MVRRSHTGLHRLLTVIKILRDDTGISYANVESSKSLLRGFEQLLYVFVFGGIANLGQDIDVRVDLLDLSSQGIKVRGRSARDHKPGHIGFSVG